MACLSTDRPNAESLSAAADLAQCFSATVNVGAGEERI
jgi:hypothetical protein